MKKYRITLTEEQLKHVTNYLETTLRLYMGQDWIFTETLCMMDRDLSPDNPNHRQIFDSYLQRRDHVREVMKTVYQIAWEPHGYLTHKTDDMAEIETVWDSFRYALGNSHWGQPMQMGHEPVPEIEIKESTDDGE